MPDSIRDLIGQQLQQYQVTAILDIGGEYRYLRAIDVITQRAAMLVILPPKIFEGEVAFAVLKDECFRILALKQAHLLPVSTVGKWRSLVYIAVPPIRESLSNYFSRERSTSLVRSIRSITDIAWAVHALHGAGFVHGDIEPGNLLFDETGQLHLADFGITRALAREQRKPHRGFGRGSTAPLALPSPYKAPELIGPRVELSVAGDIFSLGAILYQMVTGATPRNFQLNAPLPLPPDHGLDSVQMAALAGAIRQAMAPDPALRFRDARAFAVALRAASGSKTQPSPVRGEPLANALAGVWHVTEAPASDASAQQLIATLFAAEETPKTGRSMSRPLRRNTAGPDLPVHVAAMPTVTRQATRKRTRARWLIAAVAVVALLIASTLGAAAVMYGNPLLLFQQGPLAPTATPTETATPTTGTVTVSPTVSTVASPTVAPSATHTGP